MLILAATMLDWAKCEVGTVGKQSEAYLIRKRLLAQCSGEPDQAFVNRSFIITSEPDKQSLRVWASKSISIDGKNLDPLGCGQLLCSPRGHAIR
jgi:hypothetical protein